MTARLADYVEAGYELTPDERLEAARMLRLSVDQDTDGNQTEIDAAWDDVIDRRVASVIDGTATLVDGPASLAQIRAELATRRK
ncbi:addiction module protein [Microlunatus elymi]|uniref:Addiction module protein n=1 Tax=Microlunatus elymi TaxID=2596828 RepID=A0A516Q3F1_9ACTN|nr:addiction module protein [Microlunatus elymi]QDP97731.1 addiction module protein [Microlunatus elymi]